MRYSYNNSSISSKKDLKMIRQASYRNLPTVSDMKKYNDCRQQQNGEDDVPDLEHSSLDLDSFFEEEDKIGSDKSVSERKVGKVKVNDASLLNTFSTRKKYDTLIHDYLSEDGLSYDSDGSHDSNDSDQNSEGSCYDEENIFISDSNISVIIDDDDDDLLSDSSSEEDAYFIEDKTDRKKHHRGLQIYNKAFSEPALLIDNYTLHTIHEEGSECNDDSSEYHNEYNPRHKSRSILSPGLDPLPFIRSQSAPSKYECTLVDHDNNKYLYNTDQVLLSPDLLEYMSTETSTTITGNGIISSEYSQPNYCSSHHQSHQTDSEIQYETQNDSNYYNEYTIWGTHFFNEFRYNILYMTGHCRKIQTKSLVFTSSTVLLTMIIFLFVYNS